MFQKDPDAVLIREEERHYAEELLKEAFAQNRLDLDEYEKRTELLVNAKTRAELEYLIRDISQSGIASQYSKPERRAEYSPLSSPHITIMGDRTASLALANEDHTLVTVMGSSKVYITASLLNHGTLILSGATVMGELIVYVPEGVSIYVKAVPIMAEITVDPKIPQVARNREPDIIIKGAVIMGEINIVRY